MKYVLHIFSLYLLTVFVMPCMDAERNVQNDFIEKTSQHDAHQEENHSSDADHCSPFCVCSCCSKVQLSKFKFAEVSLSDIKIIELSNHYTNYFNNFTPQYISKVWQPPKLIA